MSANKKTDAEWVMEIAYWIPFPVPERNKEWLRIVRELRQHDGILRARQQLADGHREKALLTLRQLSA